MELVCLEETMPRARPDPTLLHDPRIIPQLLAAEQLYPPPPCAYLGNGEVKPYMRKEVASWMLEVCEEQGCEDVVFPLAINVMDRFLSRTHVRKGQLQLVGAVCLLVASKLRQWRSFSADQLSYYTDHSVHAHEITCWELLIMGRLRWDVGGIVANDYIDYVLHKLEGITSTSRIRQHALTFISLCTIEHQFLVYSPSVIAAASLTAAIQGLQGVTNNSGIELSVPQQMQHILGVDKDLLLTCTNEIEALVASGIEKMEVSPTPASAAANKPCPNMAATVSSTNSNTNSTNNNTNSSNKMPAAASMLHEATQPETPTDIQDVYF